MFIGRYQGYEEFLRVREAWDPALAQMTKNRHQVPSPQIAYPDLDAEVDRLLDSPNPPTALVTANDWMGGGVYAALHRRGVRVPDEISVVGFDNHVYVCSSLKPALTSFSISLTKTAEAATRLLLAMLERPDAPPTPHIQLIPGELVVRESVASRHPTDSSVAPEPVPDFTVPHDGSTSTQHS
jgi:LacI family transcriptional regulator